MSRHHRHRHRLFGQRSEVTSEKSPALSLLFKRIWRAVLVFLAFGGAALAMQSGFMLLAALAAWAACICYAFDEYANNS